MNIETVITEELRKHIDDNMSNDDIWIIVAEFQRAVKTANYAKRSSFAAAHIVRNMYRDVSWSNVYAALTNSKVATEEPLPTITYNSPLEDVERVLDAGKVIQVVIPHTEIVYEKLWKDGATYVRQYVGSDVPSEYTKPVAWWLTKLGHSEHLFEVVDRE